MSKYKSPSAVPELLAVELLPWRTHIRSLAHVRSESPAAPPHVQKGRLAAREVDRWMLLLLLTVPAVIHSLMHFPDFHSFNSIDFSFCLLRARTSGHQGQVLDGK